MNEIVDLLEQYATGPNTVAAALTGASPAEQEFRPAADRWSMKEITAHLADSEMEAALRFRFILAEDNPQLSVSNQAVWAERLNYESLDARESLELFRHVRRRNYDILKDLTADAFQRTGNHPKRGTVSLLDHLKIYANHADKHAQQIRSLRQAYQHSGA